MKNEEETFKILSRPSLFEMRTKHNDFVKRDN